MSPRTTEEIDARYANDWTRWPVEKMPFLAPGGVPWSGVDQPWRYDVSEEPIDVARTALLALPTVDVAVNAFGGNVPYQGSSYGMPFVIYDSTTAELTTVWDLSRPMTWKPGPGWFGLPPTPVYPTQALRLPEQVRREGDPKGSSDLHHYAVDPTHRRLLEMITVTHGGWNRLRTLGQADWTVSYNGGGPGIALWDTSRPFTSSGQPRGVVAAGIPQFPHIVRWEEAAAGEIDHALFLVLPNYDPRVTGYARGSDGDWTGHPVRGGERLRLTEVALERLLASEVPGVRSPRRAILMALRIHGAVQGDRNGPRACLPTLKAGGMPITQDVRWRTGEGAVRELAPLGLRLSDFEVLARVD